jgi:acetoin utilization deacetylase AcuC-like enzyme
MILDFDLIRGCTSISGRTSIRQNLNPASTDRNAYLREVRNFLLAHEADIIGVSAGFDHHLQDWGGLLTTGITGDGKDGRAARKNGGGCFGLLEGGYNTVFLGPM